jgi:hypothetical protein
LNRLLFSHSNHLKLNNQKRTTVPFSAKLPACLDNPPTDKGIHRRIIPFNGVEPSTDHLLKTLLELFIVDLEAFADIGYGTLTFRVSFSPDMAWVFCGTRFGPFE